MGKRPRAMVTECVPTTPRQKDHAAVLQNTQERLATNALTGTSAMPLKGSALHALVAPIHLATTEAPVMLRLGCVLVQVGGTTVPTAQLVLMGFGAISATLVPVVWRVMYLRPLLVLYLQKFAREVAHAQMVWKAMACALAMGIFGDKHADLVFQATLVPIAKHAPPKTVQCAAILGFVLAMDRNKVQATACAFLGSPVMHVRSVLQGTMVQAVRRALDFFQMEVRALVTVFATVPVRVHLAKEAANATKAGEVKTAARRFHALTWTNATDMVTVSTTPAFVKMGGRVPTAILKSSIQTNANLHAPVLTRSARTANAKVLLHPQTRVQLNRVQGGRGCAHQGHVSAIQDFKENPAVLVQPRLIFGRRNHHGLSVRRRAEIRLVGVSVQ